MDSREQQRKDGDLTQRTLDDYFKVCGAIVDFFGKGRVLDSLGPTDFAAMRANLPTTWAAGTVNSRIRDVSTVMKAKETIELGPLMNDQQIKSLFACHIETIGSWRHEQTSGQFTKPAGHKLAGFLFQTRGRTRQNARGTEQSNSIPPPHRSM